MQKGPVLGGVPLAAQWSRAVCLEEAWRLKGAVTQEGENGCGEHFLAGYVGENLSPNPWGEPWETAWHVPCSYSRLQPPCGGELLPDGANSPECSTFHSHGPCGLWPAV